jgi:glycosyltransferase involved in cell wall biosynthesis
MKMVKSHRAPLVSVIIPTMDRPKMLERCVNSVISNTYKNIEIIVSDDSRSEETKHIVDGLKKKFQLI